MCHAIAENIIKWCERNCRYDRCSHIRAVYGMEVFLENLWKLIGFLGMGFLLENKLSFFIAIASFSLLRVIAGGRHFKSSIVCFMFVAWIGLSSTYIFSQMRLSIFGIITLFAIVFGLILIYAPYMSITVRKNEKIKALGLTVVYFMICLIESNSVIGNAILIGCTVEAMTLIKRRRI